MFNRADATLTYITTRAAAGEEGRERAGHHDRTGAERQHLKVNDLVPPHVQLVSGEVKNRRGQRNGAQKQERGIHSDPHPLPHHQPDTIAAPRTLVLGHERVDVHGHAQGEADHGPVEHAGGHGSGHPVSRMPQQEHPIDEQHQRKTPGQDHQRQGDRHDVPTPALASPPVV